MYTSIYIEAVVLVYGRAYIKKHETLTIGKIISGVIVRMGDGHILTCINMCEYQACYSRFG